MMANVNVRSDFGLSSSLQLIKDLPGSLVDVVFVHGEKASATATWTHPDGTFWPSQYHDIYAPLGRVFLFSYDISSISDASRGIEDLAGIFTQHAEKLLEYLQSVRDKKMAKTRPIVFITHGSGRMIVRMALMNMKRRGEDQATVLPGCRVVQFARHYYWGPNSQRSDSSDIQLKALLENLERRLYAPLEYYKLDIDDVQTISFVETRQRIDEARYSKVASVFRGLRKGDKTLLLGIAEAVEPRPTETIHFLEEDYEGVCKFSSDKLQFWEIGNTIRNFYDEIVDTQQIWSGLDDRTVSSLSRNTTGNQTPSSWGTPMSIEGSMQSYAFEPKSLQPEFPAPYYEESYEESLCDSESTTESISYSRLLPRMQLSWPRALSRPVLRRPRRRDSDDTIIFDESILDTYWRYSCPEGLHFAIRDQDAVACSTLLSSGRPVDAKVPFETNGVMRSITPLQLAVTLQHPSIVDILIEYGAKVDLESSSAQLNLLHIMVESENPHLKIVSRILGIIQPGIANEWSVNTGDTALHAAIRRKNYGVAELLLRKGCLANPLNRDGWRPLHLATIMGSPELIGLLTQYKADPSQFGSGLGSVAPLHLARTRSVAFCLLQYGAFPNPATSDTAPWVGPLVEAHHHGYNFEGITPLSLAAAAGRKDVVEELVRWLSAEEIGARNGAGQTAAMAATLAGYGEICETVIHARIGKLDFGKGISRYGTYEDAWAETVPNYFSTRQNYSLLLDDYITSSLAR